VPQPNWQDDLRDFKKFGKPRLFFGVTSGCMDTMIIPSRFAYRTAGTPDGSVPPDAVIAFDIELLSFRD